MTSFVFLQFFFFSILSLFEQLADKLCFES
jgi:hypothetical protein